MHHSYHEQGWPTTFEEEGIETCSGTKILKSRVTL